MLKLTHCVSPHFVVVAHEGECHQARLNPEDQAEIKTDAAFEIVAMQLADSQSAVLMRLSQRFLQCVDRLSYFSTGVLGQLSNQRSEASREVNL